MSLKKLTTYPEIKSYCDQHATVVKNTAGHDTNIYKLNNNQQLFLASHVSPRLIHEFVNMSHDSYIKNFMPQVIDYDKSYTWVLTEDFTPLDTETFKSITGIEYSKFSWFISWVYVDTHSSLRKLTDNGKKFYNKLWENDFCEKFGDFLINTGFRLSKVKPIYNYCVVNRNGKKEILFDIISDKFISVL